MAALQKTWSGDLTQSIAGQLWQARQEAAGKRREALSEEFIGSEVDDHMLNRGEFMGHAVAKRMTSMLPMRWQHQMPDFRENPEYLMRGQSRSLMSPINPKPTRASLAAKIAGQPFPNVAVGSPLKYQVKPQSKISDKPNIVSTRKDVVKVRDQKLGKFVSEVAVSLSGSLNIMDNRMDSIDEGIAAAKDGVTVTQDQLENTGSVLEDKLDQIISLLRYQQDAMRDAEDQKEVDTQAAALAQRKDTTGTDELVDIRDDNNAAQIRNMQEGDVDLQNYSNDLSPMRGPGEFEQGGMPLGGINRLHGREIDDRGRVYDGPDTGYLANTAGASAIAPINNFFTRGQTGAAPKTGGEKPKEGREVDVENIPEVKTAMKNLQQATILPTKLAGAMALGVVGKVLPLIPIVGPVATAIKQISAPIQEMFGLKNTITNNITSDLVAQEDEKKRRSDTSTGVRVKAKESEKNERAWWDFLGWAGTGKKKGTGGSVQSISNRSSTSVKNIRNSTSTGGARSNSSVKSLTSVGGYTGGPKNVTNKKTGGIFETISNFFSLAKDRDHKVSDETMMGNTINQMQLKRYIMEHGTFPPGYQGGTGGAYGGGNLGESAQGGAGNNININEVSSPPASSSRFVNISEKSKESTFTKVTQANQKLEPIVINNSRAGSGRNPQELEHISNVGDPGLDIIYPSLV